MANPRNAITLYRDPLSGAYREPGPASVPREPESEKRMAADVLAGMFSGLGPDSGFGRFVFSPRGVATGGGLAALAGIVSAAQEFSNPDPSRSSLQNLAAGIGSGLGTTGGAVAGGLAGRAVGGMLGAPLGPLGVVVGSTLGGMVGGSAMKGLAEALAGVLEPSPEEKALRQARKQAELALELDKQRFETMLPLQTAAASAAQNMRIKEQRELAMNQILQTAGASSAAQQLAITQAMLGGGLM